MRDFEVEVEGKTYYCRKMNAIDADRIAGILCRYDVLFYTSSEELKFPLIGLFLQSVPLDERLVVTKACLEGAQMSDGEGGLMPVSAKNFNADTLSDYYQLIAEVLIQNFQKLSCYLLSQSKGAQEALQENVSSAILEINAESLKATSLQAD